MSMEERGARRGSILDLFLIVLLLVAVLGSVLRWERQNREIHQPLEQYRLILESVEMARESADCLAVGDILYTASGEAFGEVRVLEYLPARVTLISLGRYYRGEWPMSERCVLHVEVAVSGRMRDGVFLLGGRTPLAVGASQTLFSDRMQLKARVFDVTSDFVEREKK